eukprot:XP_001705151.1 Hypothetical protein GL50803_88750 [Giardia lamblia ATCC 50803]
MVTAGPCSNPSSAALSSSVGIAKPRKCSPRAAPGRDKNKDPGHGRDQEHHPPEHEAAGRARGPAGEGPRVRPPRARGPQGQPAPAARGRDVRDPGAHHGVLPLHGPPLHRRHPRGRGGDPDAPRQPGVPDPDPRPVARRDQQRDPPPLPHARVLPAVRGRLRRRPGGGPGGPPVNAFPE